MNIALLLSGGTGERAGTDIPKQYVEVCGRPVISYSMETLSGHREIDRIHIVADPLWHGFIRGWLEQTGGEGKFSGFSVPGKNRQLSILNGLADIREYGADSDSVLIHDAARPMLAAELITDCLHAMESHEGALPVLPMRDTVYGSRDGRTVTELFRREDIYAGQAPEAFRLGPYHKANTALLPERILRVYGSTEPAVLAGMDIVMIPGDEDNFKITTMADLMRFRKAMEKGL